MYFDEKILIGKSGDEDIFIYPKMANRHGMIAGATGSGKTISLKVLAESFSDIGVPVFLADVKGDLAGCCKMGVENENVTSRVKKLGLAEKGFSYKKYPVNFWDVYGEKGMPLRTTISEMGPLLLSRILGLNDIQSDILTVIFKIADDEGLLLIDTKDLRAMLQYVGENAKDLSLRYGNISKTSLGAIIRAVIALESEGADQFFGEPALDIKDWLCTDHTGRGVIQILDCQKLVNNPTMYATFLLWMVSELFENLPEAGDRDKPKMVFFFDEAHLLFGSASKVLLEKIEQVVKLIRSKGVGIFFITQSPKDIPDGVLAQLGCKIQHTLHAYTPSEQRAAKAAASAFRVNPEFDTYESLTSLGIGEALISVLDEEGIPTIVKKGKVLPPQSRMGAISDADREDEIKNNLLYNRYIDMFDRDSAYEFLQRKAVTDAEAAQKAAEEAAAQKAKEKEELAAKKAKEKEELAAQKAKEKEELAAQKAKEKEEAAAQKAKEKEELAAQKAKEKEEAAAQKAKEKEELAAKKAEEAKAKKVKSAVSRVASSAVGTLGREVGNSVGQSVGGSFGKKLGGNVGATLGRGILQTLFKI